MPPTSPHPTYLTHSALILIYRIYGFPILFFPLNVPGNTRDKSPTKSSSSSSNNNNKADAKIKSKDTAGFDDLLDDLLGEDIDAPLDKSEQAAMRSQRQRQQAAAAPAPAPVPESESEEEEDLNKVSDFRLRMAKKKMDEKFEKNLIRPGMEGYEYDKAVDFGEGEEDLSWDDSD